ncbi:hypothetical protein NDU88_007087 [Pleurodeles waltl]|uniref:Uncharacterized protein n=1 Tax=Pleurodeles waltl TaxID=8319 RepID=A0AAV7MLY2_PLEWA|nr:hypothetical protein NDU88_007087 [Pleurodeles waltl]
MEVSTPEQDDQDKKRIDQKQSKSHEEGDDAQSTETDQQKKVHYALRRQSATDERNTRVSKPECEAPLRTGNEPRIKLISKGDVGVQAAI